MDDLNKNQGVSCKVCECYFHSGSDHCTAEKIEVCNCKDCGCGKEDTFCKTFRERL